MVKQTYQKPTIIDLSIDFILDNLTKYQKDSLVIKYTIKQYVLRFEGERKEAFFFLSEKIGLSEGTIENIFYSIK